MVATCSVSAVPIPVVDGGTGAITLTSGGVLIGAGAGAVTATVTPSGLTSVTSGSFVTSSATLGTTVTDNSIAVTGSDANTSLLIAGKGTGGVVQSRGVVGGDLTIEVTNTDNTNGASNAGFEAAVGGTSSGDPYVNFLISGGRTYSVGIDNNAANDDFVISKNAALGTSNVLSFDGTSDAATFAAGVTATTGNLTATNGNIVLGTAGNKISISADANGSVGTATLNGSGTVTVATTAVKTASLIFVTINTPSAPGTLSVPSASIVDSTQFVINSDSGTDASTVNWWIVN